MPERATPCRAASTRTDGHEGLTRHDGSGHEDIFLRGAAAVMTPSVTDGLVAYAGKVPYDPEG